MAGGPWYVVAKDPERNVVEVAHTRDLGTHSRKRFVIPRPHWIAKPPAKRDLEVRIRHGERLDACSVRTRQGGSLIVELTDTADPGIAPGQFAALYDGEECLGGGEIGWGDGLTFR
jgi:tRNA-specific 2-thiouridylase